MTTDQATTNEEIRATTSHSFKRRPLRARRLARGTKHATNKLGSKRIIAVAVVVLMLFAGSGAEAAYFDSYIDMTSTVRGRNMTDPTGDFTLQMKNTDKECWCQEWVKATLKKDVFGPDPSYGTVYYETDGVWRTADWNTTQDNNTMFFHYQQSPGVFGYQVRNDVKVR